MQKKSPNNFFDKLIAFLSSIPKFFANFFRNLSFKSIVIFIAGSMFLLYLMSYNKKVISYNYSSFVTQLESGAISGIRLLNENYAEVVYKDGSIDSVYIPRLDHHIMSRLLESGAQINVIPPKSRTFLYFLINFLPNLLFLGLLVYIHIIRNPMNMINKNEEKTNKNEPKVLFKDVAGLESAKKELMKIVQLTKHAAHFVKFGAKVPRGVLLSGPPGNGKTLLARALANEAKVPFISVSGPQFVEVFVGVGASRVREIFAKARSQAPCIVFIDEIDAIGRKRSKAAFSSGGSDERESTLNQILIEMDGFKQTEGILVLAATNRADVLDTALTRPGRFGDGEINVGLPFSDARIEAFKLYLDKCKVHPDGLDLRQAVQDTAQLPTATIETIVNKSAVDAALEALGSDCHKIEEIIEDKEKDDEAKDDEMLNILAQVNNIAKPKETDHKLSSNIEIQGDFKENSTEKSTENVTPEDNLGKISQKHLDNAVRESLLGTRSSLKMSQEDKERTAYHEAGHAIVAYHLDSDIIREVTIIPTGNALGMVVTIPKADDAVSYSKQWYENRIAVCLGGIKAEEIKYGKDKISSGPCSDIENVTNIARQMVMAFCMHDDDNSSLSYLNYFPTEYYDVRGIEIRDKCDAAIHALVTKIAKQVDKMFEQYNNQWHKLASFLLEMERISGEQVSKILDNPDITIEELQNMEIGSASSVKQDKYTYLPS